MASDPRHLQDRKVGDIVYRAGSPQSVGKVIDIGLTDQALRTRPLAAEFDRYYRKVKVRWLKKGNPESWVPETHIYVLEDLIEVTEQKLANHRERFGRAKDL